MRAHLFCTAAGRSAEYVLELKRQGDGYVVAYQYGKIGSSLRSGLNKDTKNPVEWAKAARAYNRTLTEKLGESYQGDGQDAFAGDAPDSTLSNGVGEFTGPAQVAQAPAPAVAQRNMTFGIGDRYDCELLSEISEAEALRFIKNPDYLAQNKENGDRRGIIKSANGTVFGVNRKNEPLPLPSEIAEAYAKLDAKTFLLDGELLHDPGIPDHSVVWDILQLNGEDLRQKPYVERFAILQSLVGDGREKISVVASWDGELAKTAAVLQLHAANAEGVVFKKGSASWKPGRSGQHKKLPFWTTCTVRVREKTAKAHLDHNSAAIELFDEKRGRWIPVGHYSLNGKPTPKIGQLVDVRYKYFDKNSLYGPLEFLRFRDDLEESAAVFSQVKPKQQRQRKSA